MLPHEFPPWEMCTAPSVAGLREASSSRCTIDCGTCGSRDERAPEPTAAVLDAQSTRSSPQGGPSGYDAGKKVKGRKRNLVVDSLGLLLMVSVVPDVTKWSATDPQVSEPNVDSGYAGTCAAHLKQEHQIDVEVVRHPAIATWDVSIELADSNETVGRGTLSRHYERCRRLIMS